MKAPIVRYGLIASVVIIAAALGICFWPSGRDSHPAGDSRSNTTSEPPLAEFSIGQAPRVMLVPVTMNGRTLLFLVDTGAWKSAIDSSLIPELGRPMGNTVMQTSAGPSQVELFAWPKASVGGIPITGLDSVFCHDFTPFRYASGMEIYGTLGIDFLRKYAIEMDFDGGKLRLWRHAPNEWRNDEFVSMRYDESDRPLIDLYAGTGENVPFQIDSGANGSAIREVVFDKLRDRGDIQVGLDYNVLTGSGGIRGKSGYLNQIKLQNLTTENLRLDRDRFSLLGLNYLSRFKVRLDFENNAAYFQKGNRFSIPDPTATSGMSIMQINGEKIVRSVEPGGAAASQRINPGDVIVRVSGHDATDYDMVALREALTQTPGTSVPLQLRRNGEVFNATVELQSRLVR